jgi:hypothetical protein
MLDLYVLYFSCMLIQSSGYSLSFREVLIVIAETNVIVAFMIRSVVTEPVTFSRNMENAK